MTDDVKLSITAEEHGLNASLSRAEQAVRGSVSRMESTFSGLTAVFGRLQGLFLGLTATLAGGAAFGAAVTKAVELSRESEDLGRQLGISATQAGVLQLALGDVYATTEQLTAATSKISQVLNSDEDAFARLGVATRDTNGNFRNSVDILLDVIGKLGTLKEGTDRNVAAAAIFGRSWSSIEPLIRLNEAAMDAATRKARELGLVIGQEDVEASKAYRAAMNDVGDVLDAFQKTIGDALLPTLTEAAKWFAENGPHAVRSMRIAIAELKTVFTAFGFAVTVALDFVKKSIEGVVVGLATAASVLGRMLVFDFEGAANAWMNGANQMMDLGRDFAAGVVATQRQAASDVADAWEAALNPQVKTPTRPGPGGDSAETSGQDGNRLSALRTELEERKLAWQERQLVDQSGREFSKAQELAYWQDILATQRLSASDQLAVRRQIAQLGVAIQADGFAAEIAGMEAEQAAFRNNSQARLAIAKEIADRMRERYGDDSAQYAAARRKVVEIERQVAEQVEQIQATAAASHVDAALSGIDAEEDAARSRLERQQITAAQMLDAEAEFEDRRYQIKHAALEEQLRLAAVGNDLDKAELARLNAELEKLERDHQRKMGKIYTAQETERSKHWDAAMGDMQGGFSSAIASMMKGQKTFADGMQSMAASVVGSMIDMLSQITAQWIANQLLQLAATKTTAVVGISAKAAEAGAAGTASAAGAPFPLNLAAPAFGAAMFALAAGFAGRIASASGGFDVPAGLAPLTQLHPREMVLPAEIADTVRGLGRGSGRGGLNMYVSAVDPGSFRSLAKRDARSLAKAVEVFARKNFRRIR